MHAVTRDRVIDDGGHGLPPRDSDNGRRCEHGQKSDDRNQKMDDDLPVIDERTARNDRGNAFHV